MTKYTLLVAAILLEAFHSGSETGFYCVNRLRVWVRAEHGFPAARALQRLVRNPQVAISTCLVGTNIGVYISTVVCTELLRGTPLGPKADFYSSLIMPPILLVFAEVIPKSLFQHHADGLMPVAVWPLQVSRIVFYPLATVLRWFSGLPHLLLGRKRRPQHPLVTRDTFRFYLSQGAAHGALSPYQRRIAENILRLRSVELSSALSPLDEVVMVDREADWDELCPVLREHRYSRFPVFSGSRENIVGVINVLDVASAGGQPGAAELARDPLYLRDDMSVAEALTVLRNAKQQFAVVVDQEQRAAGIVTVKDLVEEIVGELEAW
jgi:CBS domain containing-hemolysin-like protein